MKNLKLELERLQHENSKLKEEVAYLEAYASVCEIAEARLYPANIKWALDFIKDNKLSHYPNYYSAGNFLVEALEDYQALFENKYETFKEHLGTIGLFTAIGEKLLRNANDFLENRDLSVFEEVELQSDATTLYLADIPKELKQKAEELLKSIDLKKEEELLNSDYFLSGENFYCFKWLITQILDF